VTIEVGFVAEGRRQATSLSCHEHPVHLEFSMKGASSTVQGRKTFNYQEMAMRLHRKIISLALAGTVLLGTAGAAFATQAVATGNVNVRSGPAAGYQRVDTLRRNEVVEVTGCRGGWCYIEKRGPDGWVSARYLQESRRNYQSSKPSINFSFSFGTPPAAPRPPRPDHGGWNGGNVHSGGGWNDRDGGWNGGEDRNRPRRHDWNN
jgi:uncharacterized protein YraI